MDHDLVMGIIRTQKDDVRKKQANSSAVVLKTGHRMKSYSIKTIEMAGRKTIHISVVI